uniref:3TM-type holin n=1 Tax=Rheinheimera sp. TaxID=1869214 RepID=UPI004048B8D6
MALQALIPVLAPVLSKVVGNLFPDPEAKAKAESELMKTLLQYQSEIESAAASIIRTEAASSHWLAANWRPLLMLVFGGLIVARWFGFAAPDLSEAEYIKLWDIVEFGIGGYVVGRSVEKVMPTVAGAFKKGS